MMRSFLEVVFHKMYQHAIKNWNNNWQQSISPSKKPLDYSLWPHLIHDRVVPLADHNMKKLL